MTCPRCNLSVLRGIEHKNQSDCLAAAVPKIAFLAETVKDLTRQHAANKKSIAQLRRMVRNFENQMGYGDRMERVESVLSQFIQKHGRVVA